MPNENTMRGCVIVGSDTDVGKTYIACEIIRANKSAQIRFGAFKPVASGCSINPSDLFEDDIQKLQIAVDHRQTLKEICAYRFARPVAPNLAAKELGETIDMNVIEQAYQSALSACDYLVVETAGGLFSPINDEITNLEFITGLNLPVIVIINNKLGAINQAMLTCHALLSRGLSIRRLIFNDVDTTTEETVRHSNIVTFAAMHCSVLACSPLSIHRCGHGGSGFQV